MSKRDEMAEKRSKRQCSTGNENLDLAISWYLKIGFEDGWDAAKSDAEARETQLVELVRELTKANDILRKALPCDSGIEAYGEQCDYCFAKDEADELLETARAKLTELNISTEEEK